MALTNLMVDLRGQWVTTLLTVVMMWYSMSIFVSDVDQFDSSCLCIWCVSIFSASDICSIHTTISYVVILVCYWKCRFWKCSNKRKRDFCLCGKVKNMITWCDRYIRLVVTKTKLSFLGCYQHMIFQTVHGDNFHEHSFQSW